METKLHTRFYERLTTDNVALLLVDHQVGLYTGVRDIDVGQLKHNVVGLAKAAKVLDVPIIMTATSPEMWGPTIPELTDAPGFQLLTERRSTRSMNLGLPKLLRPRAARS
jgi:nicotinamidase-related amidase